MATHLSELIIRRPLESDLEELDCFFERMIPLSYAENGIIGFEQDMQEEIEIKKARIRGDFATQGRDYHFLLAEIEQRIVGTIAYGPSNDLLNQAARDATREIKEIGCLLILKEHQGRGVAMQLVRRIITALGDAGYHRCCLDCGYAKAQRMWLHKLGEPHYCLPNYWNNGIDHYAWQYSLDEILARL